LFIKSKAGMKNIVLTGSSRGIGYGLAREFLKAGHRVMISGRNAATLEQAMDRLRSETGNVHIDTTVADVTRTSDIRKLWDHASRNGKVDIWINNAGVGQDTSLLAEMDEQMINNIIDTNIKGLMLCCRVVLAQMSAQGSGAIYNMEGFGSDGRKMARMSVYGTSKNAVHYFTKVLVMETKELPVLVGSISPGMVVTSMLTDPVKAGNEVNREAVKIFHILADRVETVTPFLVSKMIGNRKHGVSIRWLNPWKIKNLREHRDHAERKQG
jgi:short-subunit dehydrogenase